MRVSSAFDNDDCNDNEEKIHPGTTWTRGDGNISDMANDIDCNGSVTWRWTLVEDGYIEWYNGVSTKETSSTLCSGRYDPGTCEAYLYETSGAGDPTICGENRTSIGRCTWTGSSCKMVGATAYVRCR